MVADWIAEPEFVRYSALPSRPPLRWPKGRPVAVCVFLYFEHWNLDGDGFFDPRFGELHPYQQVGRTPDYLTHSWFQYGNRVGIFRVLEALDKFPMKVTVAANSVACAEYPQLVERFLRRKYEFAAHGIEANRMISSTLSQSEEAAMIAESMAAVEAASGRRPVGWIGQGNGETTSTPQLLVEAGVRYVADWANDEQPYRMDIGPGLVSIPNQSELDDVELFYHRKMLPWVYPGLIGRAFEQLCRDGIRSGRFLGIHVHPWMFGKAYTVRYLEEVLGRLAGSDNVWHASAQEVAEVTAS